MKETSHKSGKVTHSVSGCQNVIVLSLTPIKGQAKLNGGREINGGREGDQWREGGRSLEVGGCLNILNRISTVSQRC